jgi:serine/threonine-protein phosphatase 5
VEAVRLYTQAIELNPLDATYWCNRAAARTKLEEYGFALSDACKLLDMSVRVF